MIIMSNRTSKDQTVGVTFGEYSLLVRYCGMRRSKICRYDDFEHNAVYLSDLFIKQKQMATKFSLILQLDM